MIEAYEDWVVSNGMTHPPGGMDPGSWSVVFVECLDCMQEFFDHGVAKQVQENGAGIWAQWIYVNSPSKCRNKWHGKKLEEYAR